MDQSTSCRPILESPFPAVVYCIYNPGEGPCESCRDLGDPEGCLRGLLGSLSLLQEGTF